MALSPRNLTGQCDLMTLTERLDQFEQEREALQHDLDLGLIEPAILTILARRLSDKYCAMAQEERENELQT